MSTIDSRSTGDNSSAGLHTRTATSQAPTRRGAKRSRVATAAVALAVVLGTSGGTAAVAQAGTTASSHSSGSGGRPHQGAPPAAAGKVESVGTGTFTLKGPKGTVTVDVSSSTNYRDGKATSASFADVKVGEMVSVEGTTASGVVTATSVFIGLGGPPGGPRGGPPGGPPGGGFGHGTPPAAAGTVGSVGTNTFTLKEPNGTTVTVDVSSSTTYRDGKVTSPGFANVTVGEMVSVEGTKASGVVTATSVSIGFGGRMGHGAP